MYRELTLTEGILLCARGLRTVLRNGDNMASLPKLPPEVQVHIYEGVGSAAGALTLHLLIIYLLTAVLPRPAVLEVYMQGGSCYSHHSREDQDLCIG